MVIGSQGEQHKGAETAEDGCAVREETPGNTGAQLPEGCPQSRRGFSTWGSWRPDEIVVNSLHTCFVFFPLPAFSLHEKEKRTLGYFSEKEKKS